MQKTGTSKIKQEKYKTRKKNKKKILLLYLEGKLLRLTILQHTRELGQNIKEGRNEAKLCVLPLLIVQSKEYTGKTLKNILE